MNEADPLDRRPAVEMLERAGPPGLLQPTLDHPAWRFGGEAVARARRIHRLQRDFEANLRSVAVMLDLIDEVERLRARVGRIR